MNKSDNPFLSPEWLKLQSQYIDALKNFSFPYSDESTTHINSQNMWGQALDSWWCSVSPELPSESRNSFNHVLRQTQAFYSIIDQFTQLLSEISTVDRDNDDEWQTILARHFELMRKEFFQPAYFSHNKQGVYPWVSPFSIWQQMLPDMSQGFPDIFKDIKTEEFPKFFQKIFSLPGMKQYSHEFQKKIQDGVKLWEKFYSKSQEYHAVYEKLGISALDRLEEKILELGRKGEKISSLRELYNMWIDCNEELFSESLMDDNFLKLYGELIHILMDIKIHSNELTDDILALYNVPTKRSMDSMHQSQRDIDHELNKTRKEQEVMAAEIEKLKTELETLRNQLSSASRKEMQDKKSDGKNE